MCLQIVKATRKAILFIFFDITQVNEFLRYKDRHLRQYKCYTILKICFIIHTYSKAFFCNDFFFQISFGKFFLKFTGN